MKQKNSIFNKPIKVLKYLLDDKTNKNIVDFSNQKLEEDLIANTLEKYVFIPQLCQKSIGELKEIYIQKLNVANLSEALIGAVHNSLNELAKNLLMQESYLMSEDYTLDSTYADLPLLIQYFNPNSKDDILGLENWIKNFPDLNKQFDSFIKSVKALQDFIESSDNKEEVEAKIKQLDELKTNFTELVYDNVAGDYFNKLSKLSNDDILTKCIVNEFFAEHLKSINSLYFNAETQKKFSNIIEIYKNTKEEDYEIDVTVQNLSITDELVSNRHETNTEDTSPMGDNDESCFFE